MQYVEIINGYKVVDPERYKKKIFIVCFLAFAFDNADMMATTIGLPLLMEAFNLDTVSAGLIATCMLIGAAIGAFAWGPLADRLGRKKAYIICISWYSAFTVAAAFCGSFESLLVVRFLCGLALGGAWTIGVAYLSEFFPEHQRAKAVAGVQSSAVVGMLAVTLIIKFFVPIFTWRALFLLGALAIPVIIWFLFLPESPVWIKNKFGEKENTQEAKAAKITFAQLFKNKVARRSVILAALLVIGIQTAQWGGAAWVPTYLTSERGLSTAVMADTMTAFYIGAFIAYNVYGWMADRYGRRKTYIGISLFAAVITVLYANFSNDTTVILFAGIFGFASYGPYGPLGAFISEMFPTEIRARGVGFAWGAGRIAAAGVPVAFGGIAAATSFGFCITLVAGVYVVCALISFLLKEKGATLEGSTDTTTESLPIPDRQAQAE